MSDSNSKSKLLVAGSLFCALGLSSAAAVKWDVVLAHPWLAAGLAVAICVLLALVAVGRQVWVRGFNDLVVDWIITLVKRRLPVWPASTAGIFSLTCGMST